MTFRFRFARCLSLLLMVAMANTLCAQHRVLMQGNNKLAIVGVDGEIEWEMKWGGIHDLHVLDNGNIMVQRQMREVVEIDPATKEVVWSYNSAKANGNDGKKIEVHAFQPLPNGDVMIAESGPARIIEVNREGEIKKEFKLKVNNKHPHTDTRLVRKLENGHYLACHERDGAVREYDADGKVVWEYEIPMFGKSPQGGHGLGAFGNKCFAAERLENGNTLIATGNGHSVIEVTPEQKIVWQVHQNDLPGIQLAWVTTLEVLPNGNYMIGNCHAGPRNPLLVEVDPKTKQVVWQFDRFDVFGNSAPNSRILASDTLPTEPKLLSIGDRAPGLKLSAWLKGNEIAAYKEDTVYVVEFWATWCVECLKNMPHMSKLQSQYGERVQFVGISGETTDKIANFLNRPAEKGTWDDVIKYALATDDADGFTYELLGAASGTDMLPYAFIVGKDGRIDWMGHPASIDEPLAAIVGGTWDRVAAKTELEQERAASSLIEDLEPKFQQAIAEQKWDTALKHLDRILDVSPGNLRLRLIKMNVLLESGKSEQLVAEVTGAIEASWDEPKRLDLLAWTIAAGEGEKPKAALEAAARAAQHAAELTNNKDVSILDTLARVHYELGDLDAAIEASRKAVAIEPTEYAVQALKAYEAKKSEG